MLIDISINDHEYLTIKNMGRHTLFSYRARLTSLSFQTAVQKNEAKLSSFVQF